MYNVYALVTTCQAAGYFFIIFFSMTPKRAFFLAISQPCYVDYGDAAIQEISFMKLLSIAVPCYNSAAYMEDCVESLLPYRSDVEILIIDDGSAKDNTLEIAKRLEQKYPETVRAIHQENKGHGGAVNTGIANATGLYFKVVDSDDHLERTAFLQVLDKLEEFYAQNTMPDMLVSNFVYDKEGKKHKKVMHYHRILPQNDYFTWEDCGRFTKGHYILMHSVIFRTEVLRNSGVQLPEHTFYVDSIYVFEPLPYIKSMYYLDVDLYLYYIGRDDQSVQEKVMISRIDQQLRVNRIMTDYFIEHQREISMSPHLYKYMFNYLEIITTVSSILLIRSGTKEHLKLKDELWNYIRGKDKNVWKKLRYGPFGLILNTRSDLGRSMAVNGYKIAQKIFGFN